MSRTTGNPGAAHSPGAQLHRALLAEFAKLPRRSAREVEHMAAAALREIAFGSGPDGEDAAGASDRRRRHLLATVDDAIVEINLHEQSMAAAALRAVADAEDAAVARAHRRRHFLASVGYSIAEIDRHEEETDHGHRP